MYFRFCPTLWLGLVLVTFALPVAAQRIRDTNLNSWWVYAGDHPVKGPWGVYSEIQVRQSDFAAIEQQFQSRNAITYRFSPSVQVAVGYVYTHTGQYGDFPASRAFKEHRTYQQLALKQTLKHLEIEHRYRNEQRWTQNYTGRSNDFFWRYQNRARYQIKASLSVKGPWYVFGGDEILVPYGPNHGVSAFDQNRAFAGVGYKVTSRNKLEVGYLNQFLIQRNGRIEESNHTLRVQFSSTVPLLRKK